MKKQNRGIHFIISYCSQCLGIYIYKKEKYHVRIADVKVFSQGMAAVIGKDLKGFNMVADIGNGTMNIMQVNDERPIEKSLVTEKYGVNLCFKDMLFKNINNSLITDEDRKLSIFNPESVYLATKKIGKNNPVT